MPTTLTPEVMTPDLVEPAWQVVEASFGSSGHDADRAVELDLVDPDRFLVVRDRGTVVGTAGAFPLTMTLPGAQVPVAGVTWVGVAATHRRRGLLTAMMSRLLTERYEAGEAVAALWASEGAIYQRYGFGPAAWHLAVRVPSRAPFAREVPRGGLRLVPPDAALLAPVHDRVAARTPGWWARDDAWWRARLHDAEHRRAGAEPLRCVVTEDGDGYALYAATPAWEHSGPDGTVRVRELAAATPAAAAALWRFLLDLDLNRHVEARVAPDSALLHLLTEPRSARGQVTDALWARPLDVGAALAARSYATEVDVVLDVDDPTCPWNTRRWRLAGDPGGAACVPTTSPADLSVGVADLGAALLGGSSLWSRAAAGRVEEHRPGALAAASAALASAGGQPSCPLVF